MAAALHVRQTHHGNQAAKMETVSRRIETNVDRAPGFAKISIQVIGGRSIKKTTPPQFL